MEFEPRPIGQLVEDKTVKEFSLRERQLNLLLNDGHTLQIHANNHPLHIRLITPDRIYEE